MDLREIMFVYILARYGFSTSAIDNAGVLSGQEADVEIPDDRE